MVLASHSTHKFLVIQQKMIGDVLTSTIICDHLKSHYPNCTIDYLVNEGTTAVLDHNPAIDNIILFKNVFRKNKLLFFTFLREIRRTPYDMIIDAYGKLESNLISLFAKSDLKISKYKKYTSWIYHKTIKPSLKKGEHHIAYAIMDRLDLVRPILNQDDTSLPFPKLYVSEKEIAETELPITETLIKQPSQQQSSDQDLIFLSR